MALNNLGMGLLFTAKDLASPGIKKLERRFKSLDQTTEATEAKFSGNMKAMGVGLGMFAAGAIGLNALGGTVKDANDFNKAIGEVSTLVDEASFSTEKMRNLTMDLASQFGIDAMQQAPALYQAISAGATDVASATAIMTEANRFAIAGVTDLTSSVDVLSKAVNVYGSQGLTAADAADTMFVAIRAGVTTAEQLSRTLGRVAPLAKEMGINFQELNAAIAAITKSGLSTKESVTGLKAALANVAKPTADAEKEAKRLGIQFDAAALRSKGLAKFLESITGNAKTNKDTMLKLFGSIEGVNAVMALTTDNSKNFRDILGQMDGRAGGADVAFQKMNNTLGQQLKRLSAVWKNIKIGIGTAIAPLVKIVASGAELLLKAFDKLPKPVKAAFAIIATGVALLLTVGGAVLFFKGALGALALLMPGVGAAAAGMWAALFGPITLIVLAIGALVAAVIYFWDEIVAAWQVAVDFMVGVIENFAEFFRTLFNDTAAVASAAWGLIRSGFDAMISGFVRAGTFLFMVLTAPIRLAFAFWKVVLTEALGIMKTIANFVGGLFTSAFETLGAAASAVGDGIVAVFRFVQGILEPIVRWIMKAAETAKDIGGWFADRWGDVKGLASGAIDAINPFGGGGSAAPFPPELLNALNRPALAAAGGESPIVATAAAGPTAASRVTVQGGKTELTSKITVQLDGEKIAEAVAKQAQDDSLRRSEFDAGRSG